MENTDNKGEYLGRCNLTACTTGKPATWYNHGSYKHYCEDCAKRLSEDPVNKASAMQLFGHDLCTEVKEELESPADNIVKKGRSIGFTETPVYPYRTGGFTEIKNDRYIKMPKDRRIPAAVRTEPKIYPNQACPCGSQKKYKKCCRQQ